MFQIDLEKYFNGHYDNKLNFNQIEKDWDIEEKEKLRKQKEWEEMRNKDIARRKSLSQ